jgi:hypothetical protein
MLLNHPTHQHATGSDETCVFSDDVVHFVMVVTYVCEKNLRCFKLRLNRKLYVKRYADKLNVGDLFLRVLKCFSCLSEGRAKVRKKLTVLQFVFFHKFLQVMCMCLCLCNG